MWSAAAMLFLGSPAPSSNDAVGLFIQACINGRASLSAQDAKASVRTTPTTVTKVVRSRNPRAKLTTVKYADPKKLGIEATCTIESPDATFADAILRIHPLMFGVGQPPPTGRMVQSFSSFLPGGRYRVDIWKKGRSVAMKTTLLDADVAAQELKRLNDLVRAAEEPQK